MNTNLTRRDNDDRAVEFAILGPLRIRRSGVDLRLAGVRQRTLLAALLLSVDRPVPVHRLIDLLWGEAPPASCRGDLQANISRLRRLLAGERRAQRPTVLHSAGGYLIPAGLGSLDLVEFDRLSVAAGRAADAAEAVGLLRRALGLWRGPALCDVTPQLTRIAAPALDEQRLAGLERCLDLEIGLGQHRQVIGELRTLVAEHPERERPRELLMRALAMADRRSAALDVYEQGRRWLADELGIDPGPALQRLHGAILRNDPPVGAPEVISPSRPRPCQLPYDVGDFTGRTAELDRLTARHDRTARTVAIHTITGMAGVGKTTFAVHAAHLLADRFPDAQLFLELHGHTPGTAPLTPEAALDTLLRMIGVPPAEVPEGRPARVARWRAETAGRRLLVVLDDATGTEQIRPLLPGAAGPLVLVTSRRRLGGVDGAHTLPLDILSTAEAARLFTLVAGEPAAAAPTEVEEVVELCGHLPLAIRIAAARLSHRPAWTVRDLAHRLRTEGSRLAVDGRSVAATFAVSYQQLSTEQQRMFRLLGLHPGTDFDVYAAAALCGLSRENAQPLLEDLLDANLLLQHQHDRYRFHDLVGQLAHDLARAHESPADSCAAALDRVLDFYLYAAAAAMTAFDPTEPRIGPDVTDCPADVPALRTRQDAAEWLERERPNLVRASHAATGVHAWQLPHQIRDFFHARSYYVDWLDTHEHALAVARRLGDDRAEAVTMLGLGFVHCRLGNLAEAADSYRRAIDLRAALEQSQLATALNNLGYVYWPLGRYRAALALHHQARSLFAAARHGGGESYALCCIGWVHSQLGNLAAALRFQLRSLELSRRVGRCYGEAIMLGEIGNTYAATGRYEQALDHLHRSLELSRTIGYRWAEISALRGLGCLHRRQRDHPEAIRLLQQALRLAQASNDWSHEAGILNQLGIACHAVGKPAEALTYHERALALAERIGIQPEIARAAECLGRLAPDHDTAQAHLRRALSTYDRLGVPAAARVRDLLAQG